jgi:CubicO group peptidase (beta-lactamase class C family)
MHLGEMHSASAEGAGASADAEGNGAASGVLTSMQGGPEAAVTGFELSADFFGSKLPNQAPARCQKFVEYAFAKRGDGARKAGHRTDGLVVLKDGKLAYEAYREPWGRESAHCLWSASKTVSTVLLGTVAMDARLGANAPTLSTPLSSLVTRSGADLSGVTLGSLVDMGAGFAWNETYSGGLRNSSVTKMYYTEGFRDMTSFVLSSGRAAAPGAVWNYSSGNTNVLMNALASAYAPVEAGDESASFPWTRLFDRLGMKNAVVERVMSRKSGGDRPGSLAGGTISRA